jgi:hypothetical protein
LNFRRAPADVAIPEGNIVGTTLIAGLSWLLLGQASPAPSAGTVVEPQAADQQQLAPPAMNQPLDGAPAPDRAPVGYAGVPGPEGRNPLPRPKSDPPRLVWTGFKMAGDRSELFLQTTRPITFEVTEATAGRAPKLSVFLRNCRIHLKNNARRIDTRFFASSVEEVSARQRRKDVELMVTLEGAAAPTPRTEPGPDGTHFLVLSFPPGRAQAPAAAPAIDERVADPR